MAQLEEVKKRAAAEHKPIAWIGTFSKALVPSKNLMGKGGIAATAHAIQALQNDTILIYSDSETENHMEPAIVDRELHTPNSHYTAPVVVILTPSMDKVITKILFSPDGQERVRLYRDALEKIREGWQGSVLPHEVPAPVWATTPPPVRPAPDTLVLKGISGTSARRFALINDQTFMVNEKATVRLGSRNVLLHCLETRDRSALVQVVGSDKKQELQLAH